MEFGAPAVVNPTAKSIQIWPRAEEIGLNRSVEVGLVSDARAGLEDLLAAYRAAGGKASRSEWVTRLRTEKDKEQAAFEAIRANPPTPIHPYLLVQEVKSYLEGAGKPYGVAGAASDIEFWARWNFSCSRMGQFVGTGYTGTLGAGFPFAMGMKLARPKDNVVCFQGDGDFGYRALDIDTCLRYDIPVVSIVANDSTLGFIKREQEALFGPNRTYATDLEFRHFEKVCEALGGHGELVRETREIRPALERAFASGKPAVLNVVTGRIPSPGLNWFYRDIDPRSGPLGSG
jgi:acetolactate synthase-1/2/3 large subunit